MRARCLMISCLLLSALAGRAWAGVEKFVDGRTVLAGEADLTRVEPAAISKWVTETFKAANLMGPAGPGPTDAELSAGMTRMVQWVTDAKAQGATSIYIVAQDEQTPGNPFAVIVPVADDKAKAMTSLLNSGSLAGPSPKPPQGQAARWMETVEAIPGIGVVRGTMSRIAAIKATQPMPRAELDLAFKSAGDSPVKIAIIPTAKLQANMKGAPPPLITLLSSTKWLVASAALPPQTAAKVTVQAKDAAAATQIQQMIGAYLMMAGASGMGFTPEFNKLLTPALQGDQLTLALDDKLLVALAGELKGPMLAGKQQAMKARSASNIRQMLLACRMYVNENNAKWPDDLKAIEKYVGGARAADKDGVFTNPRQPEKQPGYVYYKPTGAMFEDAKVVVIHESHTDFGDGVNVGFADGHVEFVNDKARFDALIAATAQAAQQ